MTREFYNRSFCLEVWGDFACFTRPEMKAERVSYDVITPSAVRAIFEAIFWKPAIEWRVKKVEVLNPIQWISVRRNEVGSVMSDRSDGIFVEDDRQQRAGYFLRDVRYRLHAECVFIPPGRRIRTVWRTPEELLVSEEKEDMARDENPGKYYGIFRRRARKGQCFNQPYFGCREFSCSFRLIDLAEDGKLPAGECEPIDETRDLGFMLYDLDYSNPSDPSPAFFRARMEMGVIMVPPWESEEVRR